MSQLGSNPEPKTRVAVPRCLVLVADCLLTIVGYYAAYLLRFGLPFPKENAESLRMMLPWIVIVTGTVFGSLGLYAQPPYNGSQTPTSVIVAVILSELATMAGAFWFRSFAFPRTVFAIALPIHVCLIAVWRHFTQLLDNQCHGHKKLLLVCGDPSSASVSTTLCDPFGGKVVAMVTPQTLLSDAEELSLVFDTAVLIDIPEDYKSALIQHLLAAGVEVLMIPNPTDMIMASARMGHVGDLPVLRLPGFGLTPGQSFLKRLLDVAVAVVGLVVAMPVAAIAAVGILITSGPPIIYSQRRVGFRGREFRLWKFRTMVNGAESVTGAVLSMQGDPRVTPIGRILRALRLDELPQLLNVLFGDMSIVGPRPERQELACDIERAVPEFRSRLSVKPGLTGLAQVKGNYSTTPEYKLLFDLAYVANFSVVLDLVIMLQTIAVVLTPEKARGVRQQPSPLDNTDNNAASVSGSASDQAHGRCWRHG